MDNEASREQTYASRRFVPERGVMMAAMVIFLLIGVSPNLTA